MNTNGETNEMPDLPPDDLVANLENFWSAPPGLEELSTPPQLDAAPALKRLGPLPAARPGFPFMGFLATVYEQISTRAAEALKKSEGHRTDLLTGVADQTESPLTATDPPTEMEE